jgi:hypothetical protein
VKKFLVILGSIFLAIIVLGAIGIAFVAVRGNALDKESKAYAVRKSCWIERAQNSSRP